jgi:hypothetical protein
MISLAAFIYGDPMLLTQKLSHKFPKFAPTIRVGGLSVTDQQIVAQHPSGAVRVFERDQLDKASDWWEEQDQLRDCNGK